MRDMKPEYINKHAELLRENSAGCTVLLKKDGQFPLEKPCKIALFGSGARKTVKGGTGSGDVNCAYNTVEQALENNGFTVTTKVWLDAFDAYAKRASDEFVDDIKKKCGEDWLRIFVMAFGAIRPENDYLIPLSGEGDACVYVLARNSGEGNDRKAEKGGVLLTDTEVRDITTLNNKFKKFMLVLNVGGVVDLTPVNEVKNILLLSQLGVATGDVLADIISGKATPSGKLAATWAAVGDYQTIGDFGDMDDTRYKEGIYVGYRYFDTAEVKPIYPFGYGLSFADFKVVVNDVRNDKNIIMAKATVTNTGDYCGREVVQLYVSCPNGKMNKPYQALAAFAKTKNLEPGEKQTLSLSFNMKDCASYIEESAVFMLEKGDYMIRVGNSSANTELVAVVNLATDIVTERVKEALGRPDFSDVVLPEHTHQEKVTGAKTIKLTKSDFVTLAHDYVIDNHIDEKIKGLTDEQLCHMCIGAYLPKSKLSVLGSSACHVCGASGETSNYVYDITDGKYLTLADGPAGLRISSRYINTENGPRIVYDRFEGIMEFLPESMRQGIYTLESVEDKSKLIYQYTTAIPIGTAIAQSWDPEFAELCGDIVGQECEIHKCNFWLAPAMNIQRNILCGRNFEYYSEDPLITGKTAAGIVRGVQKHRNIGCTIKHFAANNQEWNRYNSNSIVSNRAMREIYLKGFEICVKESAPKAVMTSYNLLNGEHTSQRADLLDGILRGEWGYKGFVMTDWIATGALFEPKSKHPGVYTHKIINAGNDLMTPGGDSDFEDLTNALKDGRITRTQLMICATRVYEAIIKNNEQ